MNRKNILSDLIAGLTNALVYIPQGLAYGLVAGVSPIYGLYTGILAPIVGALTAGSTFMVVIATNELAMSVKSISADMGGIQVETLFALAILVGLFQLAFGLLRLGSMTRFISESVMTGFVTGVAVLLVMGQLHGLTGYQSAVSGNVFVKTWDWVTHIDKIDLPTTLVGVATIIVILLIQRTKLKTMAFILGLIFASILTFLMGSSSVKLVGAIADIPRSLPLPRIPEFGHILDLLVPALSLSILGLSVATGVAQAYPEPDGSIPDASRDFMGQGLANIATGFFQGIPAGGSLSRTATVVGAGAKSRLANIFTGLILAAVLLTIGGLAKLFPMAGLAGLLMVIGYQAIKPERIARVRDTFIGERIAMGLTFLLTLLIPLHYAILGGVVVTMVLFIYSSSVRVRVVEIARRDDGRYEERPSPASYVSNKATPLYFYGNLFFGSIYTLERNLLPSVEGVKNAAVLFCMHGMDLIGSSGLAFLERYSKKLVAGGNKLMLYGVEPRVMKSLESAGTMKMIGSENVFPNTSVLGESFEKALAAANKWIAENKR